jgi:penicillin-binding protein-related factor A (putative recombinase)
MFRVGLPDFSAHWNGIFFAIEAKFVKSLPARSSSKVLRHELQPAQGLFLQQIQNTGGMGIVLIGLEDVAVAIPFSEWTCINRVPNTNITLEEVKLISSTLRFPLIAGKWVVEKFFEDLVARVRHV